MALPYATPGQLEQLKKELEKKIKTSGSGSTGTTITKVSELENDAGYITESALSGYATTTALDEVKSSIPVTADFATKKELEDVKATIPSVEGLVSEETLSSTIQEERATTTEEISTATKDSVKYQTFQNPGDEKERKTIQLANHDNISGVSTSGDGANLIMMSKWDVVDIGSTKYSINLNGSKARPTYNDSKEIALLEDVPTDVVTTAELEEVKTSIPNVERLATKEEVTEAVKDTVKYQSFQNPNDDAPRKTIQLANHDTISGVSTAGTAHNLIMLSKWDKVDVGAAGVTINLNGKDARPTYNDEKELALKEDIPDISNLASKEELSALEAKIPTIPDTSSFATKEEVEEVKASIPSVEGLVSEETLASTIGEERKAITKEIETATSNLVTNETFTTTLGDYALKSELPNTEEFVKESELPDFGTFALKTEIPEVDGFATKTEVSALIKTVGEGLQVGDSEHTTNINTTEDNKVMINSVGEVVYSTPYPGEPTRKVVQFKNNDQLSGVTTTGAGVPLIFMSKWDKVEVGGNGAPLNLNGSADRVTYKDDEELAFVSDLEWIPVICNMNFRTLSDKVYTQDEIFAWFFVEDLVGLKNLILKHPVYLRYGISLSGNPMYYYIPCQYVAFTDANTLEMITDGLDTKNDKFSRYHITIKLDGTVINSASNIKVELKENVFVPDLPEDAGTKTYQLKAVNGTLSWVE